jgi:WD40 repeat protein
MPYRHDRHPFTEADAHSPHAAVCFCVHAAARSPDGRFVATASEDGSIRIVHADTLCDPAPKVR